MAKNDSKCGGVLPVPSLTPVYRAIAAYCVLNVCYDRSEAKLVRLATVSHRTANRKCKIVR